MPNPTAPTPPRRRGRAQTAGALLRGLLALTVLAALLAGLPVLLWWATSIVGPPGFTTLSSLFSTQDSGQVFLLALATAGWAGWACFAFAALLEIPAQLRGRAAPQIRGLVGQRAAAALVGAVMLALPAGTALAAPATAAGPPASVSASPVPGTPQTAETHAGSTPATAATATATTHTVRDTRPAESLWSIAAQRLGDGERWGDIAALNQGQSMTDGTVFHADQPIQPGWTLLLPADARPAATTASTPQQSAAEPTTYTVQQGDSLTGIAQAMLGSADRFQEIYDANQGQALPGGGTFNDPDLIRPGQQLTLPQTPHTTPAPAPTQQKLAPTPAPSAPTTPSPTTPAPSASSPTTPAPAASATAPTAQVPQQSTPAPATPSPSTPARASSHSTASINWALVAGLGTLLAASLAGALGVRRILQQRQRRAGQTIAQDTDPTTLEQVLGAAAEPDGVALLDQVLRTMAQHADTNSHPVPVLRGALLNGRTVRLLLDEAADPISPFTAPDDARTWVLDPGAILANAVDLHEVPAPYPHLVTLGAHQDGLLMADLSTCGVLLLDGTPDDILEVTRALALELGTCGWGGYSEILTAGLGTRLAQLLPQGRVRTMPHLPAVAADLGELLLETHQSGEQALPWMLIAAGEHDSEHLMQLADALAAARTLTTAVVLPASDTARQAFPHAEILDVTTSAEPTLEPIGLPVTLQRITDEQYQQYLHALQVSTQEAQPATGAWGFAEGHDQTAAAGHPLTVHATTAEAQDPGNPFPALLTGTGHGPATTPQPEPEPEPETKTGQEVPQEEESEGESGADAPATAQARTPERAPAVLPRPAAEGPGVRIDVLGPLQITGTATTAHSPRTAAIAALLCQRPGRGIEYLCQAMDPVTPWSPRTMHSRLSELRSALGLTSDGRPLLPRPKNGAGYTLDPSVSSDWRVFKDLASRGLAAGAGAGTADLEAALALVRGRPFEGRTLPWAEPDIQVMLSRITDIAHTLARWHADSSTPDLDAARRTVHKALTVEETSEVLYQDLLRIEAATDDQAAIRRTVARLQQMARTYDITLTDTTETAISHALTGTPPRTAAGTTHT